MNDGNEFSELVEYPIGNQLENPVTEDAIIAKYWDNIDFFKTISRKNAENLLQMVKNLENIDSVSRLIELTVI